MLQGSPWWEPHIFIAVRRIFAHRTDTLYVRPLLHALLRYRAPRIQLTLLRLGLVTEMNWGDLQSLFIGTQRCELI